MSKRIQRPRLEQNSRSALSARVKEELGKKYAYPIEINDPGSQAVNKLTLYEAKRLHAFLTKAIAYLEQRKAKVRK